MYRSSRFFNRPQTYTQVQPDMTGFTIIETMNNTLYKLP
ncbi:hypothetical protein AM1_5654 [Acaryochloris marina MBIC11017]|uniref:Uncharacterized protein n=1 Tax=Acaryochloris marina (strain MBIC 11017) TaxID=329726 RepID=B0CG48_ACAM1|nr:hypothetical protein AM1_5654 [Acaryochloris marina MBIC11017]